MNRTPRAVVDRWMQFDRVEPLPNHWQASATVASEIYSLAQWFAAKVGVKLPSRSVAEWMPGDVGKRVARAEPRVMTAEESAARAARRAMGK